MTQKFINFFNSLNAGNTCWVLLMEYYWVNHQAKPDWNNVANISWIKWLSKSQVDHSCA